MHARVMTYRIRGDVRGANFNNVIHTVQWRILPAAERQSGFAGLVLLSSREERRVVSTTYWNTEADMLESESAGYLEEEISRLIRFLSGPPDIEHFEVTVMS
jgi:heme-degrading monooxygenase HmoA